MVNEYHLPQKIFSSYLITIEIEIKMAIRKHLKPVMNISDIKKTKKGTDGALGGWGEHKHKFKVYNNVDIF